MIKTEHDVSPDIRALFLKGVSAAEKENFDYAIDILQSALVREPAFLRARQVLRATAVKKTKGTSQFKKAMSMPQITMLSTKASPKKEPLKAMEVAENILAIDPYNKTGTNILSEAAIAAELPEIAAFAREVYREGNPNDKENLFSLAEIYLEMGEADKAVKSYEAILRIPGQQNNGEAFKGLKDATAHSTIKKGHWEDKTKTYKDSMKDQAESTKIEQSEKIYKTEDTLRELIADTEAKRQSEPDNLNHCTTLAELYFQIKDYNTSLGYYKYVYEATGSIDPNLERIMADVRVRRFNQWIKEREDYLENVPEAPEADQFNAEIQEFKRDRDELQLNFAQDQVSKYPNDPLLHYNLAELYFAAGRIDEAQHEFQFAQRAPNKRQASLNYLGMCFVSKGMYDIAADQFKKCISELPAMDNLKKEVLYNLGNALELAGKKEEALESFKQIYQVDFSYRDVKDKVESGYQTS